MGKTMRVILALTVVLALASSASAQQLSLTFNNGLVSLQASNVPVRTILAEWSRLGGTKVLNAEKVAGAPLTLQLVDVPEKQALEIILRNVAGYMAAPRQAANTGASQYDRILVMPTSSAPKPTSASAGPNNRPGMQGTQRIVPPRPDPDMMQAEQEADAVNEPAFSFPEPGQQNIFQPVGQPTPFGTPIAPGAGQNPFVAFGNPDQQQQAEPAVTINPTGQTPALQFPGQFPGQFPPQQAAPQTTPFGIVGSPTPGVVAQPVQPGQPVPRPPGGN